VIGKATSDQRGGKRKNGRGLASGNAASKSDFRERDGSSTQTFVMVKGVNAFGVPRINSSVKVS